MLFYPAVLPLSSWTLKPTARVIRTHRKNTGSRWRRLDPAQQALLVVVHLYKGEPFAQAAAGFRVGTTTAWRYIRETTALLAEQAPTLEQGLHRARRQGWAFVIVDGTLIACDRLKADQPFYSGKHKRHGMNVQVVAAPDGEPLWTSWSLPGAVHDTKAARVWKIAERIETAGLIGLGDKGYVACPRWCSGRSRPATSCGGRRTPTPSTPSSAHQESGLSPSSRTGASCAV